MIRKRNKLGKVNIKCWGKVKRYIGRSGEAFLRR